MDLRAIWADEQRDFAGKIISVIYKRLSNFEGSITDTNGSSGFLGFGVKPSDRKIFSDRLEALSQCDKLRLVTGREVNLLEESVGAFPLWSEFETWAGKPQNKSKTYQKWVDLSDAEVAICNSNIDAWLEKYRSGNSVELRDLPISIFTEIRTHQIALGNYESLKVDLLSHNVKIECALAEIDRIFGESKGIENQVTGGTILWHVGCYDSASGPVITDSSPLWTTNDYNRRLDYEGQKLQAELLKIDGSGPVYLITATTRTNLSAADFTGTTFVGLKANGELVHHHMIRLLLGVWAERNKVSALIGTNRGDHEVVICKPLSDLKFSAVRIPSLVVQPPPPTAVP